MRINQVFDFFAKYEPFDGIKTFLNIFLFSSKIILLNPNIINSKNIFDFFIGFLTSKQMVPMSLFSFKLRTSMQEYVVFVPNVSSNNVCIALGKTQNAENHNPKDRH